MAEIVTWPLRRNRWVWALVPVMFEVVKREQGRLHTGIEGMLGLALVIVVARRPYKAASILLVVLPFETILFSFLLRAGVPATIMRGLGFYKEGIMAGLAVAAVVHVLHARPRLDALDKFAIAYVALGTLYLLFPALLVGTAVGAHLPFYARELGWRSDIMYVGILLVFRHLGFDGSQVAAIFRRVLAISAVIAIVGVYEFARPWSFNHFLVSTVRVPVYYAEVLKSPVPNPTDLLAFASGSSHLVRIGSILINYLEPGWFFIIGLGIAIEMVVRGRPQRWIVATIPLLGVGLILTQSRGAIIGGAAAVLFGLRARIGRSIAMRARLSSFVVLMALAGIPIVILFGLGHRFIGAHGSNQGHITQVEAGIHAMGHYPLGRGLATSQGGGSTAVGKGLISQDAVLDPEDQWLLIGIQVGVLGLALYAGTVVLCVGRLRPTAHDPGAAEVEACAAGMRNAFIGILVGACVLPVFTEPVISWTVFALCGLGVGALTRPPGNAPDARAPNPTPDARRLAPVARAISMRPG